MVLSFLIIPSPTQTTVGFHSTWTIIITCQTLSSVGMSTLLVSGSDTSSTPTTSPLLSNTKRLNSFTGWTPSFTTSAPGLSQNLRFPGRSLLWLSALACSTRRYVSRVHELNTNHLYDIAILQSHSWRPAWKSLKFIAVTPGMKKKPPPEQKNKYKCQPLF